MCFHPMLKAYQPILGSVFPVTLLCCLAVHLSQACGTGFCISLASAGWSHSPCGWGLGGLGPARLLSFYPAQHAEYAILEGLS